MNKSLFESKSIPKAYFSLSLPVVFSMVVTIIYNITDTYFIARTQNTLLVAGVSLCAPLFTLLMAFGNIFGQGGSSLISRLLGQNEKEELHRVSSFCFYIAIAFGLVAGILMLLFKNPVLTLLGADSGTFSYATSYYTWMSIGAPVIVLSFIHTNLIRAEGMSKESMFGTVGGSIINIILDPILIFTFGMGASGAAIATVLGYAFTDLFCLIIVFKKSKVLCVNINKAKIKWNYVGQIFGIGTSAALTNLMQSICLILINQSLLVYGSDKIAAMGIVQKISMIVMLVIIGFSFGGAPLIGYYYGAGDQKHLKELLSFVFKFLSVLSIAMSAALIVAATPAVHIFLQENELVRIAALMLRAQVCSMIFLAVISLISVIFQATGKAIPALILSVCRQGVVFFIVLFAGTQIAGYYGIVWAQPISDLTTAIIAGGLYLKQLKSL